MGMRRAAIVLASLHPHDCAWLIDQLRPTWRYDLKRLTAQAREIGAHYPDLAREALHTSGNNAARPEPPAPDRLLAGLHGLSPAWTARMLAACAPDHLDLYAASAAPHEVRVVRGELLTLPKALPSKLAGALAGIVRARGERLAINPMRSAC